MGPWSAERRRGGVGPGPAGLAGEEVGDVVGQQQHPRHLRRQLRFLGDEREELVGGVDRRRGDAGGRPHGVVVEPRAERVERAGRPFVPVGDGGSDPAAVGTQRDGIDAPGVDGDADGVGEPRDGCLQPGGQLALDQVEVPGEMTVRGPGSRLLAGRLVGEPVDFHLLDDTAAQRAGDDAPR